MNGAHRRVGATSVPLRKRLTASLALLVPVAVMLALTGLSVYGFLFLFLFLFDATERLSIVLCFGVGFIGGSAALWLPAIPARWLA
jgi:uncharacterized membrane protein YqjE